MRRKSLAPSTLLNWRNCLDEWLNPNLGDLPLDSADNLPVKKLVSVMSEGRLSAKTMRNYVQVVKMVVASAVNEKGKQIHPREWNEEFIDLPVVSKKKQRCPTFSGEVVTGILSKTKKEKYRIMFALFAAAGLRFGEGLGIGIKNISPDCSTIKIIEKAWRGERQRFLKTESGEREVDLHPSVAAMLREYIGERKSGFGSMCRLPKAWMRSFAFWRTSSAEPRVTPS